MFTLYIYTMYDAYIVISTTLCRVITSHLVSHGHTLVVGTDEHTVNKVWLLYVNSKDFSLMYNDIEHSHHPSDSLYVI